MDLDRGILNSTHHTCAVLRMASKRKSKKRALMKRSDDTKRVVILGAGFGGMRVALDIEDSLPKDWEIVLVDAKKYHTFSAALYEVATAALDSYSVQDLLDLRETVAVKINDIIGKRDIEFVNTRVKSIQCGKKAVETTRGVIEYDMLVVGLGSESADFGIKGLKTNALHLKSVDNAIDIRNAVESAFRNKKNTPVEISVGGGGFTGVEFAGELVGFCKRLQEEYGKEFKIRIIEAGPTLLSSLPDWFGEQAQERLEKLGVEVMLARPIDAVTKKGVKMDVRKVPLRHDVFVWTGGVAASCVMQTCELSDAKKNACNVDPTLQARKWQEIFVLGDCARCQYGEQGEVLPWTARAAVHEAKIVAENIDRSIRGIELKHVESLKSAFVIPVGGKYAIVQFGDSQFTGVLAWALKQVIELEYLVSILPITKAIQVWWKAMKVFVRND